MATQLDKAVKIVTANLAAGQSLDYSVDQAQNRYPIVPRHTIVSATQKKLSGQ